MPAITPQLSGQITVAVAGTAVRGPQVNHSKGFYLKARPDNTDTVWVGRYITADVDAQSGFPLDPGETLYLETINSLYELWFDADVSGERICWIKA